MIPEEYVGLLVGTSLTLIVSIISMILTNYFSERRWQHQKEFEQKQETIQQVYSPLYFFLENLEYPFGVLKGSFKVDMEGKEEKIVVPEEYLEKRAKPMRDQIDHINLKRIIEKNLAVMKPPQFRKEIINFMQLLRVYEESFDMIDFHGDQNRIRKQLEIIGQVTVYFQEIIIDFREFLLENILDKVIDLDKISYQPILTKTLSDKVMQELVKFANI
jgi:hypothetical protein